MAPRRRLLGIWKWDFHITPSYAQAHIAHPILIADYKSFRYANWLCASPEFMTFFSPHSNWVRLEKASAIYTQSLISYVWDWEGLF